jgi:hypothetical protein
MHEWAPLIGDENTTTRSYGTCVLLDVHLVMGKRNSTPSSLKQLATDFNAFRCFNAIERKDTRERTRRFLLILTCSLLHVYAILQLPNHQLPSPHSYPSLSSIAPLHVEALNITVHISIRY